MIYSITSPLPRQVKERRPGRLQDIVSPSPLTIRAALREVMGGKVEKVSAAKSTPTNNPENGFTVSRYLLLCAGRYDVSTTGSPWNYQF